MDSSRKFESAADTFADAERIVRTLAYRFGNRFRGTGSGIEPEDLIQEGMIAAWQIAAGFDSRNGTLRGFIYLRIRGAMVDYIRKFASYGARSRWGRTISVFAITDESFQIPLVFDAEYTDPAVGVVESLARIGVELSEFERSVVVRRFEHDESMREIGERLGYSRALISKVVNKILSRAKVALDRKKHDLAFAFMFS